MNCSEFQRVHADLQLNNVTPAESAEASAHAAACTPCRTSRDRERELDDAIRRAADHLPVPDIKLRSAKAAMRGTPHPIARGLALVGALLLIGAIAVCPLVLRGSSGGQAAHLHLRVEQPLSAQAAATAQSALAGLPGVLGVDIAADRTALHVRWDENSADAKSLSRAARQALRDAGIALRRPAVDGGERR